MQHESLYHLNFVITKPIIRKVHKQWLKLKHWATITLKSDRLFLKPFILNFCTETERQMPITSVSQYYNDGCSKKVLHIIQVHIYRLLIYLQSNFKHVGKAY